MTPYRYILDTSSKKYRCPNCHKKTFVRFIDTETGEVMPDEFGRCDRESKCKYFNAPKSETKTDFNYEYIPPVKSSYHDYNLVIESGRGFKSNNFIKFLKTVFGADEVKEVIMRYLIGSTKYFEGGTVFWQIDDQQKVRHGKVMAYNASTGKRSKDANGKAHINSVRSLMKLQDFNLKQCLFGLHLVNETDCKKIALVEGEKTAIMMSIFKPEYLWMATGSKHGFKYEYLKPLKGFEIVAFPDKSEYSHWLAKAKEIKCYGLDVSVSEWMETTTYPDGTDLADVYLMERKKSSPETPQQFPKSEQDELIKKSDNRIYSTSEKILKKLTGINPNVLELVKQFELTDINGIALKL
ncbi:DUF6371 domain-containing protein [Croceibacter atlanticus]|uniref:DUF6371 domain-containing protein n=1 Tax=Croceibacter atlanticus TaxID=313588 RepID=UPI0030DC38B0